MLDHTSAHFSLLDLRSYCVQHKIHCRDYGDFILFLAPKFTIFAETDRAIIFRIVEETRLQPTTSLTFYDHANVFIQSMPLTPNQDQSCGVHLSVPDYLATHFASEVPLDNEDFDLLSE